MSSPSPLHFIELSGHLDPPLGFPNGPYFETDLWPLVLQHVSDIKQVYLFRHEFSHISGKNFQEYEAVTKHIGRMGTMLQLSEIEVQSIQHLSFFGGHLSVLYQVSIQSPFLPELLRLYPVAGNLSDESFDTLGLEAEARSQLGTLVHSLGSNWAIVSFCHDGDPVYIFGFLASLRELL